MQDLTALERNDFFRNDFHLENEVRSLTGVRVSVRVRVVIFLIFSNLKKIVPHDFFKVRTNKKK